MSQEDHGMAGGLSLRGECVVPLHEVSVPLNDRGFVFGAALFETVLVFNGHPIAWPLHCARLMRSVEHFGWSPVNADALGWQVEVLAQGCKRRGCGPWVLKVFVSEGIGGAFDVPSSDLNPAVYVMAYPVEDTYLRFSHGTKPPLSALRLLPVPDERPPSLRAHKTTAYFASRRLLSLARSRGYDDVVFVGQSGLLAESSTAALVWLDEKDRLCAAREDTGDCLPSTVLRRIESLLSLEGHALVRCQLALTEVATTMRGAVLLSSVRGARPVWGIETSFDDPHKSSSLAHWLNGLLAAEAFAECSQPLPRGER